jgi:HEAT repeat protein
MKVSRRFILVLVFLVIATALIGAQSRELSVEESYLQQSVELMIIREQSRSESREMKLVALEYIYNAISNGNTSDEIRVALEYLGTEGTLNQTREDGRIINNFPDIRMRAATYLGALGTKEAHKALIRMVTLDNEPMVLTEVVKSLGIIGLNDDDYEAARAIAMTVDHYDALVPDNLLALSAVEAFQKLAAANGGYIDTSAITTTRRIATSGYYVTSVRERAMQVLLTLRPANSIRP